MFKSNIYIDEPTHRYYDSVTGDEYESVSRVLKSFEKPFDAETTSKYSAIKRLKANGVVNPGNDDIEIVRQQILGEWDKKRDDAAGHGTRIHNTLETYSKTGVIKDENKDLEEMVYKVTDLFSNYSRTYNEIILHDPRTGVAGTADKVCCHTSSKASVIDIFDYKTNLSKGIEYINKYNDYLYHPVSHLQVCSYNKYSLQLSMYAYFIENTFGKKIGRLGIIFIPPDDYMNHQIIPVPYMRSEVEDMLRAYNNKKAVVIDTDDFSRKQS